MSRTTLIVIDVQKGLDHPSLGKRNNPGAETNIAHLLAAWRERGMPVIHIQHDSTEPESQLRPGLPGNAIKDEVAPLPSETHFRKNVNSAFIGTDLEKCLRDSGSQSLVMVGLTTDHCVSTSVRMAENLGFDVTLVADATAAFERNGYDGRYYSADDIHHANLVSLDGEFCTVKTTQSVLDALG